MLDELQSVLPRSSTIVLMGQRGAGKTTAASLIAEASKCYVVPAGQVMRRLLEEAGMGQFRPRAAAALFLMRTYGFDVVVREAISEVPSDERVLFDGLRSPEELSLLRKHRPSPVTICLRAPLEVRIHRTRARRRGGDELSADGFMTEEVLHMAMASAWRFESLCDFVVDNDGSISDLWASLVTIFGGPWRS